MNITATALTGYLEICQQIRALPLAQRLQHMVLTDTAHVALAAGLGLSVARQDFTLDQLLTGRPGRKNSDYGAGMQTALVDHPAYLRHRQRPYRPAAIVSHSYASDETILSRARAAGLAVQFLPDSAYLPDGCAAFLLTPISPSKTPTTGAAA